MTARILRNLPFIAAFAVALVLTAPAAAQPEAVRAFQLTPRRLAASVAALAGFGGLVSAGLAMRGQPGRAERRSRVALIVGSTSATLGLLVVLTAQGGLGTGQGLGGGVVALLLGLSSVALSAVARARAGGTH